MLVAPQAAIADADIKEVQVVIISNTPLDTVDLISLTEA